MPRDPDRSVPGYDRWARAEEAPQSTPGRRLQDGRQRGQRRLTKIVAAALRAPDHGLLDVLNLAAQYRPGSANRARSRPHLRGLVLDTEDPTPLPAPAASGLTRGWLVLDELALALISEAGEHTAVEEAAWLDALRTLDDREACVLMRPALALWGQTLEWRRRLRHCDHPSCSEPYFLARGHHRRDRYCTKAHEQRARRLRTRFATFRDAIRPGRLASPPRSWTAEFNEVWVRRLAARGVTQGPPVPTTQYEETLPARAMDFIHEVAPDGPFCVTARPAPGGLGPPVCQCGLVRLTWAGWPAAIAWAAGRAARRAGTP
jgi:hypothetical protein